ncbi:MAG: hypothetical protein IKR81_06460, partial [Victivallales bacterium]|nr:hypothetical protein [Victivallales bacterium]
KPQITQITQMFSAANAAENGDYKGYGKNEPRIAAKAAIRICVICVICGFQKKPFVNSSLEEHSVL